MTAEQIEDEIIAEYNRSSATRRFEILYRLMRAVRHVDLLVVAGLLGIKLTEEKRDDQAA